jgi:hypothetical protein
MGAYKYLEELWRKKQSDGACRRGQCRGLTGSQSVPAIQSLCGAGAPLLVASVVLAAFDSEQRQGLAAMR